MKYREAKELAETYDGKLLATDPRFQRWAEVGLEDSTFFRWRNGFLMENDEFLFVFTEHYGFHVYDLDDVRSFEQYELFGSDYSQLDIERF